MSTPAIEVHDLVHRYGRTEALHGLSLTVEPGQCYGFFGRNGSGKTTTIKCLLNLLRPASGSVRVFGLDPRRYEADVKARLAYVPDFVAFYPWMSVREALDYQASFRERWNRDAEGSLLKQFQLDPAAPTSGLSKGQRTQLALIGAIAAEPEMLVLDEPTSGLDPLVRREFIQTVIGAYQDAAPGKRTVFVSTHLITEFEGLIDRFTVLDQGKAVLTADADEARAKFRRLRARFEGDAPAVNEFSTAKSVKRDARSLELIVNGNGDELLVKLRGMKPVEVTTESLTLEEIFMASVR
ncbi:MAG TPA: ABC transporter ATP-binding protein [Candidatus Limnocylindria bacterium]|jgi:ABC-2 type transport system ATP-binding protein|nr:ABC transporter ATP-binding protein [Candidatus Limnocylindria bacterium]